jgi:hypothetical protein
VLNLVFASRYQHHFLLALSPFPPLLHRKIMLGVKEKRMFEVKKRDRKSERY